MPTGPLSKSETILWPNGQRRREKSQLWWRSDPKVRYVPLPYTMTYSETSDDGVDAPNTKAGYYANNTSVPYQWARDADDVHNRCYDKFVAKTQAAASQIGASLGERRQTISMMEKRLGQLVRAARALKRGNPFQFFQELGVMPRRGIPNRSDPKRAADLWLEWHFGWEPLYGDIYSACEILQSPVPQLIKVRARSQTLPDPLDVSGPIGSDYIEDLFKGIIREQMRARVTVSNPNLWKATNLGLTNPASIAWELVPFSFVVDWFIPVGSFLGSWTDLFGLQVDESCTTVTRFFQSHYMRYERSSGTVWYLANGTGYRFKRSLGISGPVLNIRPWKGLSVTRAATAVSLLIQQLYNLRR